MKTIQRLTSPTPGLQRYISQEKEQVTWRRFRNHEGGASFTELLDALTRMQYGLCGYCEINLADNDHQIEHVIPQNAPVQIPNQITDHTNMIACCKGGTAGILFGQRTLNPDEERHLCPTKDNVSCGQAKGDTRNVCLLDPRAIPAMPSLLEVQMDGKVIVNPDACKSVSIPTCCVETTIEILGLNVRRLKEARAKRWEHLTDSWGGDITDPVLMRLAAQDALLPKSDSTLRKFFTTSRSYFGSTAEAVLRGNPGTWI